MQCGTYLPIISILLRIKTHQSIIRSVILFNDVSWKLKEAIVVQNHLVFILAWSIVFETAAISTSCVMWMATPSLVLILNQFHRCLIIHLVVDGIVIFRLFEACVFSYKTFSLVWSVEFNKRCIVIINKVITSFYNTYSTSRHLWILSLWGWWKSIIMFVCLCLCLSVLVVKHLGRHLLMTWYVQIILANIWIIAFSTLYLACVMDFITVQKLLLSLVLNLEILRLLLLIMGHVKNVVVISVGSLSLVERMDFVGCRLINYSGLDGSWWLCILILSLSVHIYRCILLMCCGHQLPTYPLLLRLRVRLKIWTCWCCFHFVRSCLYMGHLIKCPGIVN